MKTCVTILSFIGLLLFTHIKSAAQDYPYTLHIGYFGDTLHIRVNENISVALNRPVTDKTVKEFYEDICRKDIAAITDALTHYKQNNKLDDWLFYQLIRRTAQQISPKDADYEKYTLYKWYLLVKCGYNVQLAFAKDKLLFFVQSNDNIYDIPLFEKEGKQFVCLNIHDFGKIEFEKDQLIKVDISIPGAVNAFLYRVKQIPDFKNNEFDEKQLVFLYHDVEYRYNVRLNQQIKNMFNNYPNVDVEAYFNIPMSKTTYSSLIPILKKKLKGMKQVKGIDYLMNFTRHAFMYETDQENFGIEKKLSPEQTIMNDFSDCDDRVALFYYLVKETYNLPMIVLLYPSHITLAIELHKPKGIPVVYNGRKFSLCEPTPQRLELPIGKLMPELKNVAYQVMYEYLPTKH